MQQYIKTRCDEVDAKYYQQVQTLRDEKERECRSLEVEKNRRIQSTQNKRKVILIVAEVVAFLIGINGSVAFGARIMLAIILCAVAYYAINSIFKNSEQQIRDEVQQKIDQREQQLINSIQAVDAKKKVARKQLEVDINNQMNNYRKTYEQSKVCTYLVEWILNVLSIEINKADRSKWLPQVKARLRFNVSPYNIEVPNFGLYDMAAQGIHIDSNPMSVGALAYVLEQLTVAEARKRFPVDANGGRTVFTSTRNDTHIEIMYSAPNGGANTSR